MNTIRRFRFSTVAPPIVGPVALWTDELRAVEAAGYSAICVSDHFTDGYTMEPLVTLAAVAMATTDLRLQSTVLGNDYRHPVLTHRMAATLDLISGGRLELGLGAGWMRSDYDAAGLEYDPAGRRIDRLEEAIIVLKGLFGAQPFSHHGTSYNVNELDGLPKPIQTPHPPILIGGGGPRILRLAGRVANIVAINANLGQGHLSPSTMVDVGPDRVNEKVAWVREGAEQAGRDVGELELAMPQWLVHVTPSTAKAQEILGRVAARNDVEVAWLESAPGVLVGSLGQCVDKLHELRERYGMSYIQLGAGPGRSRSPGEDAIVAALAGR